MKRRLNIESISRKRQVGVGSVPIPELEPESKSGQIKMSEVPKYLRKSVFFRFLDPDDKESFFIPPLHMKADTVIRCMGDALELLNTIQFWGLNEVPNTLAEFLLNQEYENNASSLIGYELEPLVHCILSALKPGQTRQASLETAMRFGFLSVVRHLHRQRPNTEIDGGSWSDSNHSVSIDPQQPFTLRALVLAAQHGHYQCLKFALDNQEWCLSTRSYGNSVYAGAVAGGHLSCIALLKAKHFSLDGAYDLPEIAAKNGHLKVLRYLHSKGKAVTHCAGPAARGGHVSCFSCVIENGAILGPELFVCAAQGGNMGICTQLLQRNCPWDQSVCEAAVKCGNVACLQFLHQNGCPWGAHAFTLSVTGRQSACNQFLGEHDCPIDFAAMLEAAVRTDNLLCLKYLHSRGFNLGSVFWHSYNSSGRSYAELAARCGSWECAKYLITNGYYMDLHLGEYLISVSKTELLRSAVKRGCPVSSRIGEYYCRVGNLSGLEWALGHGCAATVAMLLNAARNGRFECLQTAFGACEHDAAMHDKHVMEYLLEISCARIRVSDLVSITCDAKKRSCLEFLLREGFLADKTLPLQLLTAGRVDLYHVALISGYIMSFQVGMHFAAAGDLEELKHAFAHGCPRSAMITEAAALNDHMSCLLCAVEHQCPIRITTELMAAAEQSPTECLDYVLEHGEWNRDLMLAAASAGFERSFTCAHRAGCNFTQRMIDAAARGGHFGCLQYAHENGFKLHVI